MPAAIPFMRSLPDPERILPELKERLSPERFRHSVAVAALAERLARRHHEEPRRARVAGLLHDWSKELSGPELVRYCRRYRLRVPAFSLIAKRAPRLLHAYASAHAVARQYGIQDGGVLKAIAHHTLGAPRMGRLEEIVYIADLASTDRSFPEARAVRSLAQKALKPAFREALKVKIQHIVGRNQFLHPMAVELWNEACAL
jgi:predicted HD superfamily hydrolase involved in NAD metabolism